MRRTRITVGAVGCAMALLGAYGLLTTRDIPLIGLATWLVGGLIGHDFLIAPTVCGLGFLAARYAPKRARPWLTGGLLVGGSLLLVALPAVYWQGHPSNNTVLPLNYRRNLVVVMAIVLLATVAAASWDLWRHRVRRPTASIVVRRDRDGSNAAVPDGRANLSPSRPASAAPKPAVIIEPKPADLGAGDDGQGEESSSDAPAHRPERPSGDPQ